MFRPYLVIFRQLFAFWNSRTALDLKSMYSMLLHIVIRSKMCLSENKPLFLFRVTSILRRPCLGPLRAYVPTNWGMPRVSCLKLKLCVHFWRLRHVLHISLVRFSTIYSSPYYSAKTTNYKASNYVSSPASRHFLFHRSTCFHQSFVSLNMFFLLQRDAKFQIHNI
jgi:hypothetical protein